jgi:hypothetical protein
VKTKKLQQSDLRVSFSLDVVVVAFMNTEGPLVPFKILFILVIKNSSAISLLSEVLCKENQYRYYTKTDEIRDLSDM